MISQLRHLLFALLMILPSAADSQQSELSELLIPVDRSVIATISQENDYFIKPRLYFAKRHRFVRLNEAVLRSDEPFTISLFPDTKLTVTRDSVRIRPEKSIYWKGKITNPDFPLNTFANSGMPEDEAIIVWETIVGLSIMGVAYDRDIASNQAYPANSERNAQGFKRPNDPTRITKAAFYSFAVNITLPSSGSSFQIRALEATPELHIVYEAEKSREFAVGGSAHPENERRRKEYDDYMKTLGENPRIRWALRHRESEQ